MWQWALKSSSGKACVLTQAQNTHQQVKAKILERMGEWTEMFKKNPDLGIMEQAYIKLKSQSTIDTTGNSISCC